MSIRGKREIYLILSTDIIKSSLSSFEMTNNLFKSLYKAIMIDSTIKIFKLMVGELR